MADIQLGHGVVFGQVAVTAFTRGTTEALATAGATPVAVIITDMSFNKSSSMEETADADGDIAQVTYHGFKSSLTIQCYPYGATRAAANTANALPNVGDVVKIVAGTTQDADIAATAGTFWSISSASKQRTNSAKASWTLECSKWGGITDVSQVAAS